MNAWCNCHIAKFDYFSFVFDYASFLVVGGPHNN